MTKSVPLSKGKFAVVDDGDYELVAPHSWTCLETRGLNYAMTRIDGRWVYMHVMIIGSRPGLEVDHGNGDGIDNRRENISHITHAQNIQRAPRQAGISGFRGVAWDKSRGKWMAQVRANMRVHHIGRFSSALEAAFARDKLAAKLHGKFAVLNFPVCDR